MFVAGANQFLRRDFDAEIHDFIAIVRQDDLDEIFADVVNVAFDGGENDPAARGRFRFFHEALEMIDGFLHCFGGLQYFGDDQLVVIEKPADFAHARHQRPIDDIERSRAFAALALEIGNQAVLAALDDVIREALVERQVGCLLLAFRSAPKMFGDGCDVKLIYGNLLLASLFAPVIGHGLEHRCGGMAGGDSGGRRVEE